MSGFDPDAFLAAPFDPDAFLGKPATRAPMPMSQDQAFVRGVAQGGTLGHGDEIAGAWAKYAPTWLGGVPESTVKLGPGAIAAADNPEGQSILKRALAEEAKRKTPYQIVRDGQRDLDKQAQADWGKTYLGGQIAGGALLPVPGGAAASGASLGARAGLGALQAGGIGAVYGAGASEADTLGGVAKDAAIGGAIGGTIGAAAPAVMSVLPRATAYAGNKLKDLAGYLKVNSIHPVPTLGEAMAELPGGVAGAGREMLEHDIGGLTKKGTATQARAAADEAGQAIGQIAQEHVAAGKAPVNLSKALARAEEHATELRQNPLTRSTGERLGKLIEEYQGTYGTAPVPATEALVLKRALANEAYGTAEELAKSGASHLKPYNKAISSLERDVNGALDETLGPTFSKANLSFRRLLGGADAAERTAARGATNKLIGMHDLLAAGGAGTLSHNPAIALATGLATNLGGKYGAQAGARSLYNIGNTLEGNTGAQKWLVDALRGQGSQATQSVARQSALAAALRELHGGTP